MGTPHPPHDNAYKHLFSHPQSVSDLLRGFVKEDWVARLNLSTLEKVSGSYVSDDLRDREDDIVWRVRMQNSTSTDAASTTPGDWVYVYLLLEFQSSNDPYMAVRILSYIGLLYQDLIKSGYTRAESASGKLPAVFPLVLYNGEHPWSAARTVEQLIEQVPQSLAAYRPSLRYFVMDEGRVSEELLDQPDNTIASVVQIERSTSPKDIARVVGELTQKLQSAQNRELRRALAVWIRRLVLRRIVPDTELPELQDLPEVHHMISERIDSWSEQIRKQGMQQGMQQGKLEGKLEGQVRALKRVLTKRFGALSAGVVAQIDAADSAQIDTWLDLALDATDLSAVFKMH